MREPVRQRGAAAAPRTSGAAKWGGRHRSRGAEWRQVLKMELQTWGTLNLRWQRKILHLCISLSICEWFCFLFNRRPFHCHVWFPECNKGKTSSWLRNLQELTGVGETELAALTSGLKIGPKGRFMKAVKRTAFCNGATVFIIFLVFLHISKLLHLESPPVAVFASLCTTTSVVVIALPPGWKPWKLPNLARPYPFPERFCTGGVVLSFPPFKVLTSTNLKKAGKGWAAEPFLWLKMLCGLLTVSQSLQVFFRCARLEFRSGSEWMSMVQSPSTYFASNRVMWSWSNWRYSMWLCQEWDLEAQNCKCWHILNSYFWQISRLWGVPS